MHHAYILKIQLETEVFDNMLIGENGRMIENFISENKIIIQILSTKLIFGEFLKKEYFDKKDFKKYVLNRQKKLRILKKIRKENNEAEN